MIRNTENDTQIRQANINIILRRIVSNLLSRRIAFAVALFEKTSFKTLGIPCPSNSHKPKISKMIPTKIFTFQHSFLRVFYLFDQKSEIPINRNLLSPKIYIQHVGYLVKPCRRGRGRSPPPPRYRATYPPLPAVRVWLGRL